MTPSHAERDRRFAALQSLLGELGLDVLVLAGADYRGHKGTLRWVADYNLAHRHGFAIVAPGLEPWLLLPQNLGMARPARWGVAATFARDLRTGLPEALRGIGPMRRIGIVGLAQVMKVEDYLALCAAFPDAELVDAQDAFERVRAQKSGEEIEGVRESVAIADACFDRLLELARPGVTEREIGAAMYERCYALGGEDPLFLSMYPEQVGDRVEGRFGPPDNRVLDGGEQLIFSFELIGTTGYWMELARMVVFGEPTEVQQRLNAAVTAGLEAGAVAMTPGRRPDEVQQAITEAVAAHGAQCSYWSGHGLGQDVIEEPWVGLEVVQDRDAVPTAWELADGMVLANHPYAVDTEGRGVGYMANTYLVTETGGEALSEKALDLYVVS